MNLDYEDFASEGNLPALKDLEREFDIDNENPSVADVLHSMRDRLSFFAKIIEDVLQPETSPATLQECRVFSENDKRDLYKLYSEIMVLDRKLLRADVVRRSEFAVEGIGEVWNRLPKIKERVGKTVEKMLESWTLEHGDENYSEYFG